VALGAQDMYWETSGAYTGEVSGEMLVEVGCSLVILGHSERRHVFGETDSDVARKLVAAQAVGLTPIVCVGEQLEEREAGKTWEVVSRQVTAAYGGLSGEAAAATVVAYEPVWAIGTGKVATPEQAVEVHGQIRSWFKHRFGEQVADGLRILYGGSVKPGNAANLLSEEEIDGALVGGACLEAESFLAIAGAAPAVV
jgi:triosephosphate isomerase